MKTPDDITQRPFCSLSVGHWNVIAVGVSWALFFYFLGLLLFLLLPLLLSFSLLNGSPRSFSVRWTHLN